MCTVLKYLLPLSFLSGNEWRLFSTKMKEHIRQKEDVGFGKQGSHAKHKGRESQRRETTAAAVRRLGWSKSGSCGGNFDKHRRLSKLTTAKKAIINFKENIVVHKGNVHSMA